MRAWGHGSVVKLLLNIIRPWVPSSATSKKKKRKKKKREGRKEIRVEPGEREGERGREGEGNI